MDLISYVSRNRMHLPSSCSFAVQIPLAPFSSLLSAVLSFPARALLVALFVSRSLYPPCAMQSAHSSKPLAPAPCARSSSLAPPGILPPPLHSALAPTSRLSRCPHIKEVCRNSAAHPRHDVIYLKNPEGQSPASLFLPLSPCGLTKDRDHSADVSRLRLL